MVAALGAEAHAELRAVIDGLAPPDLDAARAGRVAAPVRGAGRAGARGPGHVHGRRRCPALGRGPRTALYRVAQEALHNALRHAGASGVRVALSKAPRQVVLEVTDDGHGFAPEAPSGGLGLASMRERAAAAGGALTIRSAPGAGTTVAADRPGRGPVTRQDGEPNGREASR